MKKLFVLALAAFQFGIAQAQLIHGAPSVTVLTYHRVSPDTTTPSTEDTQITRFEEHLAMIKAGGYISYTVSELEAMMRTNQRIPDKTVAITFDDGWKSHLVAQELLMKYKLKATFYIVSGMIDTPRYVTKEDLRILASKPGFEIGTHSHTHFIQWVDKLDSLPSTMIVEELKLSKSIVEGIIKKPVYAFAWPYGYVRADVQKQAAAMGYTSLSEINRLSINDGDVSPFKMQRLNIDGHCTAAQVKKMIDSGALQKCK